jgi:hypothetical protein
VSPVRYELGSYIPEDDILYSHGREHFRSYERGKLHGHVSSYFFTFCQLCLFSMAITNGSEPTTQFVANACLVLLEHEQPRGGSARMSP